MGMRRYAAMLPSPVWNVARRAKRAVSRQHDFTTSGAYWEDRYRRGGNSGAGSYNHFAEFKASVLNEFVAKNRIRSVIEFGSGDGAQLALAQYPRYTGVDVSWTVLTATRRKYADDPSKRFLHTSEVDPHETAELALSLDVIYHLVEDEVFDDYMCKLFNAATRYVIVYSSNDARPSPSRHVRHRPFTHWVGDHRDDFELVKKVPNAYPFSEGDPGRTTFADFYIFERIAPGEPGRTPREW